MEHWQKTQNTSNKLTISVMQIGNSINELKNLEVGTQAYRAKTDKLLELFDISGKLLADLAGQVGESMGMDIVMTMRTDMERFTDAL